MGKEVGERGLGCVEGWLWVLMGLGICGLLWNRGTLGTWWFVRFVGMNGEAMDHGRKGWKYCGGSG
ncbi:uncharacterized protein BO95DRAFT_444161, partial [Aspergillus brunneoviolaceus CBS 621.78]